MSVLQIERAGNATRLTLDRPDKANALDHSLVEALLGAVEAAHQDGTELLILTGAGRNFCAGFDFTGFDTVSEAELLWRFIRIEQLLQRLAHSPLTTLVLAHGRNFGAGADLVVACQQRVASADASFRMPGLQFGLQLGTRRLAARIGADAARRMLGASLTVQSAEALALRFITEIIPVAGWPACEAGAATQATALTADARARLARAVVADTRDADMADLIASVTLPGVKDRMRRYRDRR